MEMSVLDINRMDLLMIFMLGFIITLAEDLGIDSLDAVELNKQMYMIFGDVPFQNIYIHGSAYFSYQIP